MTKLVKPEVLKIAETNLSMGWWTLLERYGKEAEEWGTKRLDGNVSKSVFSNDRDSAAGGEAQILMETAGRVCYKSFAPKLNPNVTMVRDNPKDYFANIIGKGDGSILEHCSVTFAFLNVSRVLTHELVRHRIGAYSQESLRYVRPRELPMTDSPLPPVPAEHARDMEILNKLLEAKEKETDELIEKKYLEMVELFPWDDPKFSFNEKKAYTSRLRRRLPQGMATVIIATWNHRTLRWLIEARTNRAAEIEIRQAFDAVAYICTRDYPHIYQDFVHEELDDGTVEWKPTLRSKV